MRIFGGLVKLEDFMNACSSAAWLYALPQFYAL